MQPAENRFAMPVPPPHRQDETCFQSRAVSETGPLSAVRRWTPGASGSAGRPEDGFFPGFVKGWIWLSALAGLAGWGLSALGQLNRTGYALFFISTAFFFMTYWRRDWVWPDWRKLSHRLRRFRRPLPGAFAVLVFLILLGGAVYPPSNYTGLTYRVGRVLQWLDHGQWCWIHTPDYRMNDRACGIEWIYAPLLLFSKSDRALFLVNFIPFLLLPGLVFSVLTRLGVRARVAWPWMWLLPTGYNFMLQAGSIANDTFPTVFALAALDFGLRARWSGRISDFWYSIVAAGLLTGAKAGNLPLLLPWAVSIFTLLPWLRRRLAGSILVLLTATVVSFVPTAVFNAIYCGDWSGANLEVPNMTMKHPWTGVWGNGFQLALDNLAPPVLPMAGWWNEHAPSFLPHFLVRAAHQDFEGNILGLGELPTEDWTGVGFGVCLLLVVSFGAAGWIRLSRPPSETTHAHPTAGALPNALRRCVWIAAWVALLLYCVKSGMSNAARIIAPYYPFLVGSLITDACQSEIVRRRWWRMLAGMTVVLAFIVLAVSPDRPLWPAKTILSKLLAQPRGPAAATRALEVYSVYAQRNDALAGVRGWLPPDLKTVGFIGDGNDCDISLWRPFGSRRVEHFLLTDPPSLLRSRVQYVVVGEYNLNLHGLRIDEWLQRNGAELVATTNVTVIISGGPRSWYLARFKP